MYDHNLHCGRKRFSRHCLQSFSTEEILKPHIKDCSKINGEQKIIMTKIDQYVNAKIIRENKATIPNL